MTSPSPRARSRLAVLPAAVLLVLAACGGDDDTAATGTTTAPGGTTQTTAAASLSTLSVEATDNGSGGGYAFKLAPTVPAGPTRVAVRNTGAEPHHAQLFKLAQGKTMADLGTQLATGNPAALLSVGAFSGGTGTVDPKGTSKAEAVVNLSAGSYVFMCFIEGPQGAPHLASGMVQPFEVTGSATTSGAPQASGKVTLSDFAFSLPGAVPASGVLEITNSSTTEPHEMNLIKLQDGVKAEDVAKFFTGPPTGPPKFSGVGGMQALPPGTTQLLRLDVDRGRYVVICLIPSPDGVPHYQKGMITEITIG